MAADLDAELLEAAKKKAFAAAGAEIAKKHDKIDKKKAYDMPRGIALLDAANQREVCLVRASDITPEPISWVWAGWLAAGKFHVLGGAPGTGKTTIALSLAAIASTGGRWPDGARATAGNVVIWSGEDDPQDTIVPRLALAGADLSRVLIVSATTIGTERRAFDPATDIDMLRLKLAEIGSVSLLIVDPVVSAIAGDSHKNAEVRRGLQPLADLAASMRCALVGITHFSKGTGGRDPVERLTGSLAFGALARVVMVAARDRETGDQAPRIFCRAKSNIGPDDGGLQYSLEQSALKDHPSVTASFVKWGATVAGTARELLGAAEESEDSEGNTMNSTKQFLISVLADGPVKAGDLLKDAAAAGYSRSSIQRAANALGVDRRKDGMKGGWTWRLPESAKISEDHQTQNAKSSTPSESREDINTHTVDTEDILFFVREPSGIFEKSDQPATACPACDGEGCGYCQ